MDLNSSIQIILNNFANSSGIISSIVIVFAKFLPYIVVVVTLLFLLLHSDILKSKNPFGDFRHRLKEILVILASVILAALVSSILKETISLGRPYLLLGDKINPLLFAGAYDSFPSGHATFFAALASSVYAFHTKAGKILLIIALLIGLARIAVGVHSPVDILAGYILGLLSTYLVIKLYKKARKSAI